MGGYVVNILKNKSQFCTGIESRPNRRLFIFFIALALALIFLETASALSPLDPAANIPWDEDAVQAGTQTTFANVGAIESAFTNARRQEEAQLALPANSLGNMTLPAQASWDALSLAEKALLIVNSERVARAGANYGAGPVLGLPLEAVEGNINTLSQAYADYMIANNFWDHNAPATGPAPFAGTSPFDRIDNDPVIGNGTGTGGANCHQPLSGAENLGAFASSPGTTIPMPVERAIYGFIYNDAGSAWGHRHLVLLQDQSATGGGGFINDRGSAASEGFLGIGNAGVTDGSYSNFDPVRFPVQQAVVFMLFDPTSDAACNYAAGTGNNAPVLTPIPDQMVTEMAMLSVPLMATDPNADTLTLTATKLPAFCALTDNGGGMGTINCNPGAGTAGTFTVTVTVTDNGAGNLTNQDVFDIVVIGMGNQPPVLAPIGPQTVMVGNTLNIPLSAMDPDGNTIVLSQMNVPDFCVFNDTGGGMGSINCTPMMGNDGTAMITVTATDNGAPTMQDNETFMLTVTPAGGGTITQCSTPGLAIPDGSPATPAVNTLAIADPRGIGDLNVSLTAPHTWVGDLTVTLRHIDTGTAVVLLNQPGGGNCSEDNVDA